MSHHITTSVSNPHLYLTSVLYKTKTKTIENQEKKNQNKSHINIPYFQSNSGRSHTCVHSSKSSEIAFHVLTHTNASQIQHFIDILNLTDPFISIKT